MTSQLHLQSVAHGECVTEPLLLICHQLGIHRQIHEHSQVVYAPLLQVSSMQSCSMSVRLMVDMLKVVKYSVVKYSNCHSASRKGYPGLLQC